MKKILFIAFLFLVINTVKGQQFHFETGKTISTFKYLNSQDIELDNIEPSHHTFMNLGYRKNIFTEKLFLNLDGTYAGYGSIGSDRTLDNFFEWDVSYLGLRVGLDYEIFETGNFTFLLNGAASTEFLLQGTQTLNDQVYKLQGTDDFAAPLYFLRAGLGVSYDITDNLSFFTRYTFGRSGTFKNIAGKLNINAHSFGFGFLVNISKDPPSNRVQSAEISELKKELEVNTRRVEELKIEATEQVVKLEEEITAKEEVIIAKEEEISTLRESISSALLPYSGRGLTVEERFGKVYVTMENDMLFQSASWKIGTQGEEAVNALGKVLEDNPDVSVVIEGHTDNDLFRGAGNINTNWDLSAKRATAIVELLIKNENIDPKNLSAAGRGEFDPIADNTTIEGKSKNRRIEVIITPRLDEVLKLIKE